MLAVSCCLAAILAPVEEWNAICNRDIVSGDPATTFVVNNEKFLRQRFVIIG